MLIPPLLLCSPSVLPVAGCVHRSDKLAITH